MIRFTPKGEAALEALAEILTNQMARTPEGIARTLHAIYHTDIEDLAEALTAVARHLETDSRDVPGPRHR